MSTTVSVVPCKAYELERVREAVAGCLEPLGGMKRFVKLGMHVLLKPNMFTGARPDQAVTTHPLMVQVVAELVEAAGGEAIIGDSSSGQTKDNPAIWKKTRMVSAAEASGTPLVLFDGVSWREVDGVNYFIARPALEADLVINLPKLKTHDLTLYSGAVKNIFGVIPGMRKRDIHLRAPGVPDFSRELVNLLAIIRPGLTIMDGVVGLEGQGPGPSGTPHAFGVLAASSDPVALDAVMSHAMGFKTGEVTHLLQASERGLGVADLRLIHVAGGHAALNFGPLAMPHAHWFARHIPGWLGPPMEEMTRLQPRVDAMACTGCGKCAQVCPGSQVIEVGRPIRFNPEHCIGCMCCAEVCPQAAIHATRGRAARLLGLSV